MTFLYNKSNVFIDGDSIMALIKCPQCGFAVFQYVYDEKIRNKRNKIVQ